MLNKNEYSLWIVVRQEFFCYQIIRMNFFLGHSMNIFEG